MKNINTFFKVIFNIKEIPDTGLLHFAHNHIENLSKHNTDGKYDFLIETTSYLFQGFHDAYTQKHEVSTSKRDQTSEVNILLEETKQKIRKLAAYIHAFHNKDSEIYKSFFPNGLSEYSRITKSNIKRLMSQIYYASTKYESQIDTKIISNVIEIDHSYQTSRDEQIIRKKIFKNNVSNKNELRKQLAIQLQINLFELAKEYIGIPNKETLFFNSSLLKLKTFNKQNHLLIKNVKELVN